LSVEPHHPNEPNSPSGARRFLPVAALFVRKDSHYRSLGADCFDLERDARTFRGGCPVVAHPPCRLWGRLAQFVNASREEVELELALGLYAAALVKREGGVLEHPANSRLFKEAGLPEAGERSADGFTIMVPQVWFGHRAPKRTWLFFSRVVEPLPSMPFAFEPFVGGGNGNCLSVARMSHRERELTPYGLAEYLVRAARTVYDTKCASHS